MKSLRHLTTLAHHACRNLGSLCCSSVNPLACSRNLSSLAWGTLNGIRHKCSSAFDLDVFDLDLPLQPSSSIQSELPCFDTAPHPAPSININSFVAQPCIGQPSASRRRQLTDGLFAVSCAELQDPLCLVHNPGDQHPSAKPVTTGTEKNTALPQKLEVYVSFLKGVTRSFRTGNPLQPKVGQSKSAKRPLCACPGCTTLAYFNVAGSMGGLFCAKHRVAGMVDVINARCRESGCTKQPLFNVIGSARGWYCKAHKKPDMIDVVSRRCEQAGCDKVATYNHEGARKVRCAGHAVDGMVDVHSKRCEEADCRVRASFGIPKSSHRGFCGRHKKPGMVSGKSLLGIKDLPESASSPAGV